MQKYDYDANVICKITFVFIILGAHIFLYSVPQLITVYISTLVMISKNIANYHCRVLSDMHNF